jgi:hypothetical protein
MRPKRKPFRELPRKRQRDNYIRLKNQLALGVDSHLFTTPYDVNYNQNSQWFDFKFLGRIRRVPYTATMVTTNHKFWDDVQSIAYDNTINALTPESRLARDRESFDNSFEPIVEKNGKVKWYEWKPRTSTYPEFGGLTFNQYWHEEEQRVVDTSKPIIHESIKLDYGYHTGIGVHFVVNEPKITVQTMNYWIRRFYELGERNWTNLDAVPSHSLPTLSEHNYYKSIQDKVD